MHNEMNAVNITFILKKFRWILYKFYIYEMQTIE